MTTKTTEIRVRIYAKTEEAKERIGKISPVCAALDKVNERRIALLNEQLENKESDFFQRRAAYFAAKKEMEKAEKAILAKDTVINELSRTVIRSTFAVINGVETVKELDKVGVFDKVSVCDTLQKVASAYQSLSASVTRSCKKTRTKKEEKTKEQLLAEAQAEIERLKAQMAELTANG